MKLDSDEEINMVRLYSRICHRIALRRNWSSIEGMARDIQSIRDQKAIEEFREAVINAGFWFVDIPRTGSTTLKNYFGSQFGEHYGKGFDREYGSENKKISSDHMTAAEARRIIGPDIWKGIFKFTIVRDPVERFKSLYRYRILRGDLPKDVSIEQYCNAIVSFDARVEWSPFRYHGYYYPMLNYLEDENGELLVDHIGRFEKMADLYNFLGGRIGLIFDGIKHRERSEGMVNEDCSKFNVDQLIREIYKMDCVRYNY